MYVIKEMRLNRFQPRPVLSNREVALANGESLPVIQSKDTADCYEEPSILGASKLKVLGLAHDISTAAYAHKMAEDKEKLNKSQSDL